MLALQRICRAGRSRHVDIPLRGGAHVPYRHLLTLAIETSCDDTSVAILEKRENTVTGPSAVLHFHEKVTADTHAYGGIHPVVALESHQASLGPLVGKAIKSLPTFSPTDPIPSVSNLLPGSHDGELRKKPDFISVTRGPGMRSNLATGLELAKGLSLAWNIPLLGIHHMQAHALTPRLVSALARSSSKGPSVKPEIAGSGLRPQFPFLSLLVSGGHTMLISSVGINDHDILATTCDTAIGDCVDKAARAILPAEALSTPYGRALEQFAFPAGASSYEYDPPRSRGQELERRVSKWGWSLGSPLAESRAGNSRRMVYSYSGILAEVERLTKHYSVDNVNTQASAEKKEVVNEERRMMAREVQRVAFEHLASRLLLYLGALSMEDQAKVRSLVVSGGVAANGFLKHVLRSMLDVRGYEHIELLAPPIELCTDNAAMIAWAGCEMWESGWKSELSIKPIKKWSLSSLSEDGGIMGVGGWTRR